MSFREAYSVTLSDGIQADVLCGPAATRELKSQSDALKEIIVREVTATHEVPNLPFIDTRITLRNLLLPVVKRIGHLSPASNKRFCTPLLDQLYPPGWFFSPTIQEELEWGEGRRSEAYGNR